MAHTPTEPAGPGTTDASLTTAQKLTAAALLLAAVALAIANARHLLDRPGPTPHLSPPVPTTPARIDMPPRPGEPIAALMRAGQSNAIDHEPADLPPYPGAVNIHRFSHPQDGLVSEISASRISGATIESIMSHYESAATRRGFERAGTGRGSPLSMIMRDPAAPGRTLTITPRPTGDAIQLVVVLLYPMGPRAATPTEAPSP